MVMNKRCLMTRLKHPTVENEMTLHPLIHSQTEIKSIKLTNCLRVFCVAVCLKFVRFGSGSNGIIHKFKQSSSSFSLTLSSPTGSAEIILSSLLKQIDKKQTRKDKQLRKDKQTCFERSKVPVRIQISRFLKSCDLISTVEVSTPRM